MTRGLATGTDVAAAPASLPTILRAAPMLVLSPHLDDAALSCAALLDRGAPIDLLTVFDGSPDPPLTGPWDVKTGFSDSSHSMSTRHEENRRAFAGSGHELSGLGLLDLQYRGDGPTHSDRLQIERAVLQWIGAASDGGTVAAPAGAGRRRSRLRTRLEQRLGEHGGILQHPDHVLVRDAAIAAVATAPEVGLLLYEELPYFTGGGAGPELSVAVELLGRECIELTIEIDREEKARRIAAYRSQVPHLRIGTVPVDDPASLPGCERYFFLPGSGARGG